MSLAGTDNHRNVAAIALLALFLSFSSFSLYNLTTRPVACFPGDIGTSKCALQPGTIPVDPQVPLGVWANFPLSTQCSTGNYTAQNCELLGNTTYRGTLNFIASNTESGVRAGFSATCINPSNTVGAILQLQYANYSAVTHLNTTNFVNFGGTIKIDNSANWPCPGNLVGAFANLPPTLGGVIFRIVGTGGGGVGDNPRFSSVTVNIGQLLLSATIFEPLSITTSGFTANVRVTYPTLSTLTLGFRWIATNSSNTLGCGIGLLTTDVCIQHGSGSCSAVIQSVGCNVAVTYPTAFSGTVDVTGSGTNTPLIGTIPVGNINLLQAQTLTV